MYNVTMMFLNSAVPDQEAIKAGFRLGAKGTHSCRTIMLDELNHLFANAEPGSNRAAYAAAIIEGNCLAKPTTSTRRLTNQRLGELYGLDPSIPVFRIFRKLWELDKGGRPLLTLLCGIARDPLLAATAPAIISLPAGADFLREPMKIALRAVVSDRLNESSLNKVIRNTASSWTQSGHLQGRTLKKRQIVHPNPVNIAFALYLAHVAGFRGGDLLTSGWITVLDCSPVLCRHLALEAKRQGLLDLRMAGEVIEINLDRLDSESVGS
jgi:hypothetical protein